jgi:predicted nucleic acid-binding protein
MRKTVYIETSIPSTYYEQRPEAVMVARRDWTRKWWDEHRGNYRAVTSAAVVDELARAEHPQRQEKLRLLEQLEMLMPDDRLTDIVEVYIKRFVMPRDPAGDALHLAMASVHGCDFLLTWNCDHLANANKTGHIRAVNALLGIPMPMIVTPLELLGEKAP